jgi:hypothetical protein
MAGNTRYILMNFGYHHARDAPANDERMDPFGQFPMYPSFLMDRLTATGGISRHPAHTNPNSVLYLVDQIPKCDSNRVRVASKAVRERFSIDEIAAGSLIEAVRT